MSCSIRENSIDLEDVKYEAGQTFLVQVIDEAQDVLFDNVDHVFLDGTACRKRLLLSSQCQSSTVSQDTNLFPGIPTVRLTEVIRSTQRIIAGAATFHSNASERQGLKSVCPDGPPLKTFIFNSQGPSESLKGYVQKTVQGIWFLVRSYSGLSLHHRLALLVPDADFLEKMKPLLGEALMEEFPGRFELASFQESLSILPPDLHVGLGDDKGSEVIMLDHMDNSRGLESLFVICIALDEQVATAETEAAATRARLYRGITRAQVQALVINERISGGWLEFLGFVKFEQVKFEESKGLQETKGEAAAEVISPWAGSHPEKASSLPDTLPKDADKQIQKDESNAFAVNVTSTLVWDTNDNDPATADIQKLMFDPRAARPDMNIFLRAR